MKNRDKQKLKELELVIGYEFKDPSLFINALTHSSYANENHWDMNDNERLEFLGDAVLGMVIANYLYRLFNQYKEGDLTKIRASIVSELALSEIARTIGLGEYLYLGRGESNTGGKERDSVLADAMEAVIGAVYLDGGIQKVEKFIINLFTPLMDKTLMGKGFQDYKTNLQEILQRNGSGEISYKTVSEMGPDHDKSFVVEVYYDGKIMGRGRGKSKKEAEQGAAREAVERIRG